MCGEQGLNECWVNQEEWGDRPSSSESIRLIHSKDKRWHVDAETVLSTPLSQWC